MFTKISFLISVTYGRKITKPVLLKNRISWKTNTCWSRCPQKDILHLTPQVLPLSQLVAIYPTKIANILTIKNFLAFQQAQSIKR